MYDDDIEGSNQGEIKYKKIPFIKNLNYSVEKLFKNVTNFKTRKI